MRETEREVGGEGRDKEGGRGERKGKGKGTRERGEKRRKSGRKVDNNSSMM